MGLKLYNETAFERLPSLVVFDLDNTLYDYERSHRAGLGAAARKANVLFGATREPFTAAYYDARKDIGERLRGTASSHSRLLYFTRLCELIGVGAQPAIALDLEQTYWTAFLDNAAFFPDAVALLDDLRLARIPMALVTDLTTQIQYRKLVYWSIDQNFSAIVTSEEAGRDKPDSACFDLLKSKLGGTECEGSWSIGDSLEKDIVAAKRHMGAVTLLRADSVPSRAPAAEVDLAFDNFGSIRTLLAKLIAKRG